MKSKYIAVPVLCALAACGSGNSVTGSAVPGTSLLASVTTVVQNGVSTVVFPGNRASYSISASGGVYLVTDLEGSGGTVSVTSSQRAQFADINVAFDTGAVAGQAYRVYQAAFNRVPDTAGLGFWISVMDSGASLRDVAAGFVGSAEFKTLYGSNPSNTVLATAFYTNVLHRTPDTAGLNYWIGVLDQKADTVAGVLTGFSESDENKAYVASAIASGISYVPMSRIAGNTVPGAPTLTSVSAGDAAATVVFSSPASNGGSAITGYTATCAGGGTSRSTTGSASPLTVSGLTNGVEASCTVKATNALGNSAASSVLKVTPVAATPAASVPSAPTLTGISAGNASASLSFSAPTSNGGAAITSYAASCVAGASTITAAGSSSPVQVTGLSNGTSYSCSLKAINAVGAGLASNALSVTPVASVVASAPGAPTIGTATAGNASASISFTAPSNNGGASISAYTASCTGGGVTRTASGTSSPLSVSSLSNGTTYSCSVTATNSAGTSTASGTVQVTPSATASTVTGSIYCPYSHNVTNSTLNMTAQVSITCSGTTRSLSGNGIPDHDVGTFPNSGNPNSIKAQTITFSGTLNPALTGSTTSVDHVTGYAYNSVKMDPATAESYQSAGVWKIEALNQTYFPFGVDSNNAHVQPDGTYHYHGMPELMLTKLNKGKAMTLIGFAIDGFPVYARYGYTTATDATSAVKVMTSSYRQKTSPSSGRPSTSIVPMGTFTQDYEYVSGLGDLDECNGRFGVTPEFPSGIYHYYVTDTYPYIQRCVKGTAQSTP